MKPLLFQNIKYTLLFLLILCYNQHNQAQEQDFWSRVRYGGNIGLGLSNNTFSAIVAPSAIYRFSEKISAGTGIHFGYTNNDAFTATNYGASVLSLFNPIPAIQLSAEFEQMGVSRSLTLNNEKVRDNYWYPALFLGAGYQIGMASIGIRYDVLYDSSTSIYGSAYAPFVRVFF